MTKEERRQGERHKEEWCQEQGHKEEAGLARAVLGRVAVPVVRCLRVTLGAHDLRVPRVQEGAEGGHVVRVTADTGRSPWLLDPCPPHLPQPFAR